MPWAISNHNNNPAHTRMITRRQRLLPPIHICGPCPASCSHSHLARLTYKNRQNLYKGRQTNTIMCENLYCICISSEKEGTNNENMQIVVYKTCQCNLQMKTSVHMFIIIEHNTYSKMLKTRLENLQLQIEILFRCLEFSFHVN